MDRCSVLAPHLTGCQSPPAVSLPLPAAHPPVVGALGTCRHPTERYDDDLEGWLASDERRDLLDAGARFRDFRLRTISGGFGSWIPSGDRAGGTAAPPSWKTALSVLVGLYPTVVLLTLAISALWPTGPLWASLLVGNVASVALLTWVVMPGVTRALGPWLTPRPDAAQPRTDALGAVASLAFLTAAAVVFWLVTVEIHAAIRRVDRVQSNRTRVR